MNCELQGLTTQKTLKQLLASSIHTIMPVQTRKQTKQILKAEHENNKRSKGTLTNTVSNCSLNSKKIIKSSPRQVEKKAHVAVHCPSPCILSPKHQYNIMENVDIIENRKSKMCNYSISSPQDLNSSITEEFNYKKTIPKTLETTPKVNQPKLLNLNLGEKRKRYNNKNKNGKITSSYKKYGVYIPSVEQILKEKQDFENYKQFVDSVMNYSIPTIRSLDLEEEETSNLKLLDCKHLSLKELKALFKNNVNYLDDIYYENIPCTRNEKFKQENPLHQLTMQDLTYNTSMILFSFDQKQYLVKLLCKRFGYSSRLSSYYFKVLLPELCLKIFMDIHSMNYEEATKYLDERPVEMM